MATAPPDVRSPAPLAGGSRAETDPLGKPISRSSSPASRRVQHLTIARQLGDEIRLRHHALEEHLAAAGIAIEDFTAKEQVKELVRDLNVLIEAGGDPALLRPAVEPHVKAAAIDFRAERDRRKGWGERR
jgi:hypothetical protein